MNQCDDEYGPDYAPVWAALVGGAFGLAAAVAPELMKARAADRERRDQLLVAAAKSEADDEEALPSREEFQEWIRAAVKAEVATTKPKRGAK